MALYSFNWSKIKSISDTLYHIELKKEKNKRNNSAMLSSILKACKLNLKGYSSANCSLQLKSLIALIIVYLQVFRDNK